MPHFLTILHPVRETFPGDGTPEEFEIVHEHFAYLQKNLLDGKLILAGPTRNTPPMGIGVIEVEDYDAAVAHLANDPDIQVECYGFGICDAYGFAEMPNWPENTFDWTTTPATVTGVAATPISSSAIDVSWDAQSATGFRIERRRPLSTSGGIGIIQTAYSPTWTVVGTVDGSQTVFHDTGLSTATNYSYRVQAYSALNGTWSSEAQAETFDVAPTEPTNLFASATSQTTIELDWTKNSTNETGFKVERLGSDGSTWSQIALTGHGVTTYTDSGLTQATSYTYRVRATNSYGDSANAGPTSATTYATPPAAPTNLSAMAVSTTEIDLSWTDNSNNEQWFYVERSGDGGNTFHVVATVNANQTLYSDTGLTDATTYYYRVRASNSGGNSAYTNVAYATTLVPSAPVAPTNLVASAPSNSEVDLTWQDNSNNEDGFTIQRLGSNGTTWSTIGSTPAGTANYSDSTASPSTTYTYRVCAYNGGGSSPWSNLASATTSANSAVVGPAGAPVYTLAIASSSSSINLYWAPSSGAASYKIYRSLISGGPYSVIATVMPTQTNQRIQKFIDVGLTSGTPYYYAVTSITAGSESNKSPETSHFPNPGAMPLNGSAQQIVAWAVANQPTSEDGTQPLGPSDTIVCLPDDQFVDGSDYSVKYNLKQAALEQLDPTSYLPIINPNSPTSPQAGGQYTAVSSVPQTHYEAEAYASQASYLRPGSDITNPYYDQTQNTLISYQPDNVTLTSLFTPINSLLVQKEAANIYIGFKSLTATFGAAQSQWNTVVGTTKVLACDVEIGFQMDHFGTNGIKAFRWTPYFRTSNTNNSAGNYNSNGIRFQMTSFMDFSRKYIRADQPSIFGLGLIDMHFSGDFNKSSKYVGAKVSANLGGSSSLLFGYDSFPTADGTSDFFTVPKIGTGLDQSVYYMSGAMWNPETVPIFYKKGHISTGSKLANSWANLDLGGWVSHSTSNTTAQNYGGNFNIEVQN